MASLCPWKALAEARLPPRLPAEWKLPWLSSAYWHLHRQELATQTEGDPALCPVSCQERGSAALPAPIRRVEGGETTERERGREREERGKR